MSKKAIILFIAEIAAVAILRLTFIVRRDKLLWPRSSKVRNINRTPVYRPKNYAKKRDFQDRVEEHEIGGWTPAFEDGKIQTIPDTPPDA